MVTSFNALPAMNLERFLLCDVFFFGTARRIDSHISASNDGRFRCRVEGIAMEGMAKIGKQSCLDTTEIVRSGCIGLMKAS